MDTDKTALPDFSGKTVVFYTEGRPATATISSPEFEWQAGRLFIVGNPVTSSGHWAEGADVAFAWDRVCSYLAFDHEI